MYVARAALTGIERNGRTFWTTIGEVSKIIMNDETDLSALREGIRDYLLAECSLQHVLAHVEAREGIDRNLWNGIVAMGWTALAVPETAGGMGLGIKALALAYEEMGRSLTPLPYLSTMLAAGVIEAAAAEPERGYWLRKIVDGAVFATAPWASATSFTVAREGDILRLTGALPDLLDAADADFLLLAATDCDHKSVRVVLDLAADGDIVERRQLWDRTRNLGAVKLEGLTVPVGRLFVPEGEDEEALLSHAAIGLAADAVGGSDAVLALTIDYLKARHQFGQSIGSFQALKHRIADHRTRLEGDRALLRSAVAAVASSAPDAHVEASAAKALACTSYVELGGDAIQLHGGIGYTAEYACHLFTKRAWINEAAFGGRELHLDRALQLAWGSGATR